MDTVTKRVNKIKNILVWFEEHPNEMPDWIRNPSEMKKHLPVGPKQKSFIQNVFSKIAAIFSAWFGNEEPELTPMPSPTPDVVVVKEASKKALLVGINKYQLQDADLRGCINDVENMRDVLINIYRFNPENIRVLTDYRATKRDILSRLHWLIDDSVNGDELVFHYSGHGCFTGDTPIKLLNGEIKTFKELTEDYKDQHFWVYSCTENGAIVPGKAHSARITKKESVIGVKLDNGETIKCTRDHLFMLRDGSYEQAQNLIPGTSLMPLYSTYNLGNKKNMNGYEMVYVPSTQYRNKLKKAHIESNKQGYVLTHRLVAYANGLLDNGYKGVIHHVNYNKIDNTPENLKLFNHNIWNSHTPEAMKKKEKTFRKTITDKNSKWYISSEDRKVQLIEANQKANHVRWHDKRGIVKEDCCLCQNQTEQLQNHKVVEIIDFGQESHDVYDITVEKYHNFALASGVFVHNSQVRDRNGDELDDDMDEILIPTDHDWSNPLTDDNIGEIFRNLAPGANLTMFCDSCHSGTMNRSVKQIKIKNRFVPPPFDIFARSEGLNLEVRHFGKSPKSTQRHVLISGCKDNQTSADAYINKKYQGAFSWALIKAIKENPNESYKSIHAKTLEIIKNYSQIPQLSGDENVISRRMLGGIN